ncbi:MAG: PilZ domain-containing protein [Proteobacteria bacterium]|nr:PilZ domain-containing protein [Pseudomonadota bacterium]MBU1710166.1 PilZ domain-containing protein [Pseudomonadota bacterium]
MDYRENRIQVAMSSTVSDGNFFYEGMVANVSRSGLRISDLPKRFDPHAKKCTTVITGKGESYKLVLEPCWSKDDGLYQEVGFRIISSPLDWALFMDEIDSDDADIWGANA